jgi:hypothetical protein
VVTLVLYLNKSAGKLVNPEHPFKQFEKLVTSVLYLNKPVGRVVKEVHPLKQL